jgi:hypothetical protein
MADRDRLIELLMSSEVFNDADGKADAKCLADHLLANGVIVQKQGEWTSAPIKDKGYDSKTIPTCTNCGYQSFITYTYCPECGAKLKERADNG